MRGLLFVGVRICLLHNLFLTFLNQHTDFFEIFREEVDTTLNHFLLKRKLIADVTCLILNGLHLLFIVVINLKK